MVKIQKHWQYMRSQVLIMSNPERWQVSNNLIEVLGEIFVTDSWAAKGRETLHFNIQAFKIIVYLSKQGRMLRHGPPEGMPDNSQSLCSRMQNRHFYDSRNELFGENIERGVKVLMNSHTFVVARRVFHFDEV